VLEHPNFKYTASTPDGLDVITTMSRTTWRCLSEYSKNMGLMLRGIVDRQIEKFVQYLSALASTTTENSPHPSIPPSDIATQKTVVIQIWALTAQKGATKEQGHIALKISNRENISEQYISYRPTTTSWLSFFNPFGHIVSPCCTAEQDHAMEGGHWCHPQEIRLETLPNPQIIIHLWEQFKRNMTLLFGAVLG